MTKRTIKETVTEYDENGKVVRTTVTETTEEDDSHYITSTEYKPLEFWYNQPTASGVGS